MKRSQIDCLANGASLSGRCVDVWSKSDGGQSVSLSVSQAECAE